MGEWLDGGGGYVKSYFQGYLQILPLVMLNISMNLDLCMFFVLITHILLRIQRVAVLVVV